VSQIVTFYSYKGGVGRSMALANIAVLLARRNLRVLVVDWDLEAPGLERYFTYFTVTPRGEGLINLFAERAAGQPVSYREYLWTVTGDDFELSFLPSGKDVDADYSLKLERFDWDGFFAEGGGEFVESLRERWLEDFDVVLIDSRTGLSDTGGICTIQLPDVVVAMFTANHQSLYGVRDVLRLVQGARQSLAYDRTQLAVVPLASRFGVRTEFRESQEWLDRFADTLSEFYLDWLPAWVDQRQVVEQLKIPQVDFFGFGEKLAVVEQGTSDPDGMGFVYDRVSSLLANNLDEAEHVLGLDRVGKKRRATRDDYYFDVYVSYARSPLVEEELRSILALVQKWGSELKGEELSISVDYTELAVGAAWTNRLQETLARSRLLLAVLTPRYFRSPWTEMELQTFVAREERAKLDPGTLIVPIHLDDGSGKLPDASSRYPALGNYTDLPRQDADTPSLERSRAVEDLAVTIVDRLKRVPPFSPELTKLPASGLRPSPKSVPLPRL
jgi:MinD-like ATPase involved in chromosome partitioning or flagellar assembly